MQVTELSAEGLKRQFKIVVPAGDLDIQSVEPLAEPAAAELEIGIPALGAPGGFDAWVVGDDERDVVADSPGRMRGHDRRPVGAERIRAI